MTLWKTCDDYINDESALKIIRSNPLCQPYYGMPQLEDEHFGLYSTFTYESIKPFFAIWKSPMRQERKKTYDDGILTVSHLRTDDYVEDFFHFKFFDVIEGASKDIALMAWYHNDTGILHPISQNMSKWDILELLAQCEPQSYMPRISISARLCNYFIVLHKKFFSYDDLKHDGMTWTTRNICSRILIDELHNDRKMRTIIDKQPEFPIERRIYAIEDSKHNVISHYLLHYKLLCDPNEFNYDLFYKRKDRARISLPEINVVPHLHHLQNRRSL